MERSGETEATLRLRENIKQLPSEENESWEADEYALQLPFSDTLESRIKAKTAQWLTQAKAEYAKDAAAQVGEKRKEILTDTDQVMALDRLGLTVPTGTTFAAWLPFMQKLAAAITGPDAAYRQELRDLTAQPGYPVAVEWPAKPYVVGRRYEFGEKVKTTDGTVYEIREGHTAQLDWVPATTYRLYTRVPEKAGEILPWAAGSWKAGARVTHKGDTWTSGVDNNIWEPGAVGVYDNVWKKDVK